MRRLGSLLVRHDCEEDHRCKEAGGDGDRSGENGDHLQDVGSLCRRESIQPGHRLVGQPREEPKDQGKGKRRDKEGTGKTEEEPLAIGSLIGMYRDAEIHARSVACIRIGDVHERTFALNEIAPGATLSL